MKLLTVMMVLFIALTGAATAHEFKFADIEIVHPFLRVTPPGAQTGAVYRSDTSGPLLGHL